MKARAMVATLNRSAIVVTPRQPFLDWLRAVDPTSHAITLQDLGRDPAVYLLPECETDEHVSDVLRELCEDVFVEQLASWFTDATSWPTDRGFDVFCRWFDYRQHSMLIDMCDEPLKRD
jgi:hypothetical protein